MSLKHVNQTWDYKKDLKYNRLTHIQSMSVEKQHISLSLANKAFRSGWTAAFPWFLCASPAERMPTLNPATRVPRCAAVSGCSVSAWALILALNSSWPAGKSSNWGIFSIINLDEQPSHPPFPSAQSLILPTLITIKFSHSSYIFFFLLWIAFRTGKQIVRSVYSHKD